MTHANHQRLNHYTIDSELDWPKPTLDQHQYGWDAWSHFVRSPFLFMLPMEAVALNTQHMDSTHRVLGITNIKNAIWTRLEMLTCENETLWDLCLWTSTCFLITLDHVGYWTSGTESDLFMGQLVRNPFNMFGILPTMLTGFRTSYPFK